MGVIIRNSQSNGTIARRVDTILRTPIIKRIFPDQKKICQIGDPKSIDSAGYITTGYQGGSTYESVVENVGYQMINQLINGQPRWLDASSAHDPEFVWYQGAYATSATDIATGKYMSEAYSSFPGFHFTMPNIQPPLAIIQVVVYYLNMGTTLAFGPAISRNARNMNITQSGVGNWNLGVTCHFHVLNTPTCNYHPMDINNNSPDDAINISTVGSTGDFRGYRDIFAKSPLGTVDGCIPTLTNPVVQSYSMSANTLAHFTQNGAGWIVPTYHPWMDPNNPSGDFFPNFGYSISGQDNSWGCASLRDVFIDVVIDAVS